jgi:uncharacterized protein
MPYVLLVVVLGLAQCAAAVSGLIHLGAHPMLAVVAAGATLAFASPLLALPGLYGAIVAWHWHWLLAFALFFPTLALMLPATGFFSAWSLLRAAARPRLAARAPSLHSRFAIGALAMAGVVVAGILVAMPETIARSVSQLANPLEWSTALSSAAPGAITPAFDCRSANNAAESLVCGNPSLAELDRKVESLLASLPHKSGAGGDWQVDQLQWMHRVRDACTTVDCLEMAYRSRIESLQIAVDAASTPSPQRESAAVARDELERLAQRAGELTRNSGRQDYLFRLCGMSGEADELRHHVEETSALYYQYGKYVLGVELTGFEQAMDSFAAGERDARDDLVNAGASPESTCSDEVLRALRARYDVERNGGSYRAELYISMATAVADAKRAKGLLHKAGE